MGKPLAFVSRDAGGRPHQTAARRVLEGPYSSELPFRNPVTAHPLVLVLPPTGAVASCGRGSWLHSNELRGAVFRIDTSSTMPAYWWYIAHSLSAACCSFWEYFLSQFPHHCACYYVPGRPLLNMRLLCQHIGEDDASNERVRGRMVLPFKTRLAP